MSTNDSTSLIKDNSLGFIEKSGLFIFSIGLFLFFIGAFGGGSHQPKLFFGLSLSFTSIGALIYILKHYLKTPAGVKNNNITTSFLTNRGAFAWMLCLFLTGFYILMYWYPSTLRHLIKMTDPLSSSLRGRGSDQYFLYSSLYTFLISIMGIRAIVKYRHSAYQVIRTLSIIFFQSIFAYLIPAILVFLKEPEKYLNYFWPLSYQDIFPSNIDYMVSHPGKLSIFLLAWSIALSFIGVPILTYYYGKRWYCSWVCGCGGLANTLGDSWRQLSSKKLISWKIERISIYAVLLFIITTTVLLWIDLTNPNSIFGSLSQKFRMTYGTLIGMVFAGVVGTGFYPIFGTRIWCRFGCPQAAILGILQRFFSRFRITTNGSLCISCGNCSTYCEMGIDVKWYAQRGQNIVRASCVGCGVCSTVCPRGVLNLENGPSQKRTLKDISLVSNLKAGNQIFPE